jgi:hypothetical protein
MLFVVPGWPFSLTGDDIPRHGRVSIIGRGAVGDPQIQSYTMPVSVQAGFSSSTSYGTVPVSYSQTTYTRFLYLEAVEAIKYRANQKTVPVWKTTVMSTEFIASIMGTPAPVRYSHSAYLTKCFSM